MKNSKEYNSSRKGDIAEHYAVSWLWEQGYEVFKNCGATGVIDIVAVTKENKTILIDVKTIHEYSNGHSTIKKTRTPKQIELGVVLLGYLPETNECRWIKHHDKSNVEQLQLAI
tara:strand:+ start:101 stop:442 length:342 start_codon:yes stop_codon:yes gene_type:complete